MNSMDVDHFDESKDWFDYIHDHLDDEEMLHRCNWASFCASQVQNLGRKCLSAMLPLLQDEVATHVIVRHTMDIIDQVHKKLKLNQPLVITADQHVYANGKVRWLYPDEFSDNKVLMMMDPLHIDVNFLQVLSNWLESSGWTASLVKAKITSSGKAKSFLSGSHPKRSRYAHQVTCASLSLLLNGAYQQTHKKMIKIVGCPERKGNRLIFCTGVRSWN